MVEAGAVRVTYRAWQAPRVRVGVRYSLGDGSILIEACVPVRAAPISDEEARNAGFRNRKSLLKAAAHRRPAGLSIPKVRYRTEFRYKLHRPARRYGIYTRPRLEPVLPGTPAEARTPRHVIEGLYRALEARSASRAEIARL
jgi:hypothetical protein